MVIFSVGVFGHRSSFLPTPAYPGVEVKSIRQRTVRVPAPRFARSGPILLSLLRALAPVALGDVIEGALFHVPELVEEVEDVLLPAEIDVVGLDDEEGRRLVVEEEVVEGLDDVLEVLLGDVLFDRIAFLGDAP